ncbi:hypothetical protein LCGC14_1191080 [marine sediment metagenome]|uniref:Uncharacterized protein n=1 Tax=marine sediment metagenome TaxID=412755 RepID=A0A0F9LJB7_9ZZZZ
MESYIKILDKKQKLREVYEKLELISGIAQKVISIEEKRFGKLHKDFRQKAEIALEELRAKLNATVNEYRINLPRVIES